VYHGRRDGGWRTGQPPGMSRLARLAAPGTGAADSAACGGSNSHAGGQPQASPHQPPASLPARRPAI